MIRYFFVACDRLNQKIWTALFLGLFFVCIIQIADSGVFHTPHQYFSALPGNADVDTDNQSLINDKYGDFRFHISHNISRPFSPRFRLFIVAVSALLSWHLTEHLCTASVAAIKPLFLVCNSLHHQRVGLLLFDYSN